MIEDMKISDLKKLMEIFGKSNDECLCNGDIRIVVLQRGWILIGKFYQEGSKCRIENGYIIRRWGTTAGLGELAKKGKFSETILDPIPTARFHELTIVNTIDCDEEKWKELCR